MKSSIFVTCSSVFFLSWLTLSYVTSLKPEPRLGRGSLPISAQTSPKTELKQPKVLISEENTTEDVAKALD